MLRAGSRDIDEPARYGGEELAVALPETDLDGAYLLAERVRLAIEALEIPRLDGRGVLRVTASFGAAALPDSADDRSALVVGGRRRALPRPSARARTAPRRQAASRQAPPAASRIFAGMGLLDEAIREHLELKREHGADPRELARLEDEALSPPVRETEDAQEATPRGSGRARPGQRRRWGGAGGGARRRGAAGRRVGSCR